MEMVSARPSVWQPQPCGWYHTKERALKVLFNFNAYLSWPVRFWASSLVLWVRTEAFAVFYHMGRGVAWGCRAQPLSLH